MADGNIFALAPLFSTLSAAPIYGDDWPAWQRELYPATYKTDANDVLRLKAKIDAELASQRRCAARALRSGDRRGVDAHRRQVDRLARWSRNCETQLRLIAVAASAAYCDALALCASHRAAEARV